MRQLAQALIILSALMFAAPAVSAGAESKQQYFRVVLPEGFSISKKSPVEDFEIHTIAKNNVPYVKIYIGNAPDFPQLTKLPGEDLVVLRTREMSLLSRWHDGEIVGLEVVIVRLVDFGWPRIVHAWTVPEAPDKRLAQRILLSLNTEEDSQ